MADVVTSTLIANGPRNLIYQFTNESDGTGESGVKKVDAQSTTFANMGVVPGIHLKIIRVVYSISNGALRIQWDASSATDATILGAGVGTMDYSFFGGLKNPNNAGATGSILFTTVGFQSGSSYSVDLEMIKGVPQ